MYKIIISLLIILFASLISTAQDQVIKSNALSNKTTQMCCEIAVFKLFPTENIWTLIKLNTRNGKMWQVQYDVEGDNRLETFLNILPLVNEEDEVNGRFTLYSTNNIYNFILLDQINGKIWQVQWSMEFENRIIVPIN